jgi:hypothetical protein
MSRPEALDVPRLLVARADALAPSQRGTKWPVYTEAEIIQAKEALDVLGRSVIR